MTELDAAQPLGRVARPADVARVVRFLGLEDADFVTGQRIVVDGGADASPTGARLRPPRPRAREPLRGRPIRCVPRPSLGRRGDDPADDPAGAAELGRAGCWGRSGSRWSTTAWRQRCYGTLQDGESMATTNISINFLTSADSGDVVCTTRIDRRGRRAAFLSSELVMRSRGACWRRRSAPSPLSECQHTDMVGLVRLGLEWGGLQGKSPSRLLLSMRQLDSVPSASACRADPSAEVPLQRRLFHAHTPSAWIPAARGRFTLSGA